MGITHYFLFFYALYLQGSGPTGGPSFHIRIKLCLFCCAGPAFVFSFLNFVVYVPFSHPFTQFNLQNKKLKKQIKYKNYSPSFLSAEIQNLG